MRPTQKSEKLLPATFDLLRHKRQYQTELLTLAGGWCHQPLRQGTHWFYFQLWSMLCKYLRPASAAKQAVKTDNANWDARLESNLQLAVDMHDSRTAWGFCRLPAPAAELHLRCSSLLRDNGKHTWQRSGEQKSITLQWWTGHLAPTEFSLTFRGVANLASTNFGLRPNPKKGSKQLQTERCLQSFGSCCLGLTP